jgi:spermidine synthase
VLLAVLTVVAMTIAPQLPRLIVLMQQSQNVTPTDLAVILTVSGVLLFPIALVLGTSIPLCWHLARSGPEKAAQHAGKILAANTLGGLAGSMAAGFGAVPLFGVELSLLLVMFLHLVIGGTVLQGAVGRGLVPRVAAVAGPLALGMLALSAGPTLHLPFLLGVRAYPSKALLKGPSDPFWEAFLFMEEGRNTTVTVLETPGKLHLYNDGRPESHFLDFEPGIGEELVVLGGLPSLYAEQRERALVIGLGAGHTATMLLQGPWRDIHVVELEEAVVHAARFMHEARGEPFPVDDPRVRLTVDDARAQLVLAAEGSLDTVVSQPSHPWLAGSSALYTREFFLEVRRALRPKGVFSLWVNLFRIQSEHVKRILATLVSVFPNVNGFVVESSSLILVASTSPLVLGAAAEERFEAMGLARFLKRRKLNHFSALVARRELDGPAVGALDLDVAPIVDDRPALEFELASLPPTAKLHLGDLDQMFSGTAWMAPPSFQALPADERLDVVLERIRWARTRPLALDRVERSLEQLDLSGVEDAIVRGALAAARGDVGTALGHFDSVEHPIAATLADQLRAHQLSFGELADRAMKRKVPPKDPTALIRAAIALVKPDVMAHAVAVAEASPIGEKSPLLPVLEAMHDSGCEGVLAIPSREIAATDDDDALFLAERCAMEAGKLGEASWLGDERSRVREVLAQKAAEAGVDHMTNGNVDAAILHFRRALAKNPGHAVAATSLASVLASRGDMVGARRVLVAAHFASRGLPGAEQVARAAAELGVPLPRVSH